MHTFVVSLILQIRLRALIVKKKIFFRKQILKMSVFKVLFDRKVVAEKICLKNSFGQKNVFEMRSVFGKNNFENHKWHELYCGGGMTYTRGRVSRRQYVELRGEVRRSRTL